ncbi:DegT/DnrJ/EryC1/StrS family aminotransferase [Streptomyces sp. C36]|uniref:DegT/DnrJ/EryC1/StrS family aminotransferase n=1 Tax=Streptomyces sp. C36 TaxID=3237122 RepID=UPI0034C622A1
MGTEERLAAAGVGPGDDVVVPSYAPAAVAEAVRALGAQPVFADIDPASYCLDPASAAGAMTLRTAAVVAVHLFGHPADLTALRLVAAAHDALLVEHMDTPSPTDPAALTRTEAETSRRRANAAYLSSRLTGVLTPVVASGVVHRYDSYVVRVPGNGRPDRDAFARALRARGVRCRVPVRTPVYRMPPFRRELWLPEAERAAGECLELPVDAELTRRDLQRLVSACNALGGLVPLAAA